MLAEPVWLKSDFRVPWGWSPLTLGYQCDITLIDGRVTGGGVGGRDLDERRQRQQRAEGTAGVVADAAAAGSASGRAGACQLLVGPSASAPVESKTHRFYGVFPDLKALHLTVSVISERPYKQEVAGSKPAPPMDDLGRPTVDTELRRLRRDLRAR